MGRRQKEKPWKKHLRFLFLLWAAAYGGHIRPYCKT